MLIGGHNNEKGEVGSGVRKRLGGVVVAKVGGSVKRFNQIGGWNTSLKQERADNIVDGTNDALGFTILRRGVGARHTKMNAPSEEESTGTGVF
jgi:hypothetical protein